MYIEEMLLFVDESVLFIFDFEIQDKEVIKRLFLWYVWMVIWVFGCVLIFVFFVKVWFDVDGDVEVSCYVFMLFLIQEN